MDEYTRISHKRASINIEKNNDDKKVKYLKQLVTRVLLSLILVISVGIYIKLDSDNKMLVDEYFFKESLKFTKINNWYKENVGKIIPDLKENTALVFNSADLTKNSYIKQNDGVKISVDKNSPISLINGGIVVFIGDKGEYGNTLILQGNDGIDYWYGGITNINVNLYDYLEKDTLIGESKEDYIFLVLQKDGAYLDYEKYVN